MAIVWVLARHANRRGPLGRSSCVVVGPDYDSGMRIWNDLKQLREARQAAPGSVALVPTMGALHAGHLSLVEFGRRHCDEVWVSVFVNPTQFGPGEDFERYPRTLESDLAACEAAGVTGVFAPPVEGMYPDVPPVAMDIPRLTAELEGAARPGHFPGVCRVVAKLLLAVLPDAAVFGRKDYQQWRVIDAMAADLFMPTKIVAAPTVYEPDGLAMSSRNRYLSEADRIQGLGLSAALTRAQQLQAEGQTPGAIESAMSSVLAEHGVQTDYAVVRDAADLAMIRDWSRPAVALVAGRVGQTRLLDNRALG